MKNFKRLVAGTIAATMALALSVSAFAEVEVTSEDNITYASAAATYGNTITAKDGTQMTVVIFDATKELANLTGEDLLYINQDEEGKLSLTSMGTKVDLLEANEDGSAKYAGEYVIRVGYYDTDNAWQVAQGKFTIAKKVEDNSRQKGDIVGTVEGEINADDVVSVLQMSLGVGTWEDAQKDAADVVGSVKGEINADDVVSVLQKSLGISVEFKN